MKVFKIFLRLKCKEVWNGSKVAGTVLGFTVLTVLIIWLCMSIIGVLLCLALGYPITIENMGELSADCIMVVFLGSVIYFMLRSTVVGFIRWIRSNWKEAKRLAGRGE